MLRAYSNHTNRQRHLPVNVLVALAQEQNTNYKLLRNLDFGHRRIAHCVSQSVAKMSHKVVNGVQHTPFSFILAALDTFPVFSILF